MSDTLEMALTPPRAAEPDRPRFGAEAVMAARDAQGPIAAARWVLRELAARGIVVTLLEDRLRVHAQPGVFTPACKELVVAMKAEIIAALTLHPCAGGCGRHRFIDADTTCYWCRKFGADRPFLTHNPAEEV